MKIRIIQPCRFSYKDWQPGEKPIVSDSLGEKLIAQGKAVADNFVTLTEQYAETVSLTDAEDIVTDLPTSAKKLINQIPSIVNKHVLDHLSEDERVTVRNAANKRKEQLGY